MYIGDLQPFSFAQGMHHLLDLGCVKLYHLSAFQAGKVIVRLFRRSLKVSVALSQGMIFHHPHLF